LYKKINIFLKIKVKQWRIGAVRRGEEEAASKILIISK